MAEPKQDEQNVIIGGRIRALRMPSDNEIAGKVMTEVLDRPISMRLQTLLISGLVVLFASGALGWVVAQSNNGQRISDAIAANGAQIANLSNEVKDLEASNARMSDHYVTQDTFAEFKRAADADRQERHDFQVRMDQQIALLVSEHAKPVRQR